MVSGSEKCYRKNKAKYGDTKWPLGSGSITSFGGTRDCGQCWCSYGERDIYILCKSLEPFSKSTQQYVEEY